MLHQGTAVRSGLSIGTVVIVVSLVVLLLWVPLLWVPLRQRPGIGTLTNVLLVGLALDATMAVRRHRPGWAGGWCSS